MLQMFYSLEVTPTSTVRYMMKHNHLCPCLQENLRFPSLEAMLLHIISAAQTIGVLAEGMQLVYCWK